MTIWFTSDHHFNHANIIEYSMRPFESLEHMTETLIANWNDRVKRGDAVYHLGDFALSWGRKHAELIDSLLARLNGQKWLIKGNHDRDEVVKNKRWHAVKDYHELKVYKNLDAHGQRIVLSHYSLRTWNQAHRGSWMLYGHSHGNLPDIGGKTLDVGVDCWNYAPVSLDELRIVMNERPVLAVDHHIPDDEFPVICHEPPLPELLERGRIATLEILARKRAELAEGWIDHDGKSEPVSRDQKVRVRCRCGLSFTGTGFDGWIWNDKGSDILAYMEIGDA